MVVLEQASVVELDRDRLIKARLIHGFQPASQPAHGCRICAPYRDARLTMFSLP
jgi:hypothetical protein